MIEITCNDIFCPVNDLGTKLKNSVSCEACMRRQLEIEIEKIKKCENCIEWEYFEGYGYGCFAMRTMSPIDAEKCEFYTPKSNIPHSWKPCIETEGGE